MRAMLPGRTPPLPWTEADTTDRRERLHGVRPASLGGCRRSYRLFPSRHAFANIAAQPVQSGDKFLRGLLEPTIPDAQLRFSPGANGKTPGDCNKLTRKAAEISDAWCPGAESN